MGTRYPDVGRCIYCGETEYAPDSKRFLGLEHIIPEAISGDLELPQASCYSCERLINPWETRLLRGQLLGARTLLGLDTKRPKDRPTHLPLFDTSVTPNRKVLVDLGDCPVFIMLSTYDDPCAISRVPIEYTESRVWFNFLRQPDMEVLAKKYNLYSFALSSLDTLALQLSLAKMAHAYLAAEVGLDHFIPLLPNAFSGRFNGWLRHYVGGVLEPYPDTPSLHEIGIEQPTNDAWRYWVVRIRLFARLGGPTYRIIAGERLSPTKPLEVLLAEVGGGRSSYRTPVGDPLGHPIPKGLLDPNAPSANEAPSPKLKRFLRFSTKD